jgi:class 3 adenylate cyclase
MEADEAGTLDRVMALRADLLHPKVATYGSRVVKATGDGTLIEFPSAVDAVQHAVDVQGEMARGNADMAKKRVKMGLMAILATSIAGFSCVLSAKKENDAGGARSVGPADPVVAVGH